MIHPPSTPDAKSQQQFHRFISRADAFTLLGMVLLIFSLFLVWNRTAFKPQGVQTIYVGASVQLVQTGFSLPDWTLMMSCAVACNLCLLWNITPQNRYRISIVQGVLGVGTLFLVLRHLSPNVGSIIGTVAGAMLAWGALERFQEGQTQPSKSET